MVAHIGTCHGHRELIYYSNESFRHIKNVSVNIFLKFNFNREFKVENLPFKL